MKVSLEQLKMQLRETGVKYKPSYEFTNSRIVSSALKDTHKIWMSRKSRENNYSYSTILSQIVNSFKPIEVNTQIKLGRNEAILLAGLLGQRVGKVFGTRKNIKFTSFTLDKDIVYKLDKLSEYYGISRSAMIRQLIELEMNK